MALQLSYEFILRHFRARRGLYILGAGASAGIAPLGPAFWPAPTDYLQQFRSFPAIIPQHDELTTGMIDSFRGEILAAREIRPGTELPPFDRSVRTVRRHQARYVQGGMAALGREEGWRRVLAAREIRPGTELPPCWEILQRMRDSYARLKLSLYRGRVSAS
jgi:hypothetical protein